MKRQTVAIFAFLASFVLSSCSTIEHYTNNNENIVVSVSENQTFSVLSSNPQTIKKGENASFRLSFVNGYCFDYASSGVFENEILTIKAAMYSQTITVTTTQCFEVRLLTDSHFSVTSSNPVNIKKGENAVFDVALEPGFKFEPNDNYRYDDGKLIFCNILESCNVNAKTVLSDMFKLKINNNDLLGAVSITPLKQYYDSGDIVNITINPISNNRYVCLSEDKDIHTINNSTKPFSFKQSLNLEITRDFNLFVNYNNDNDYLMEYDLNGGVSFEGEETIMFDYRLHGLRIRPNSLVNDQYFLRDGYYLESFNTKKDGSGTRIGIGSRINTNLFDDKYIKLYCQWLKETDSKCFETNEVEEGLEVVNYFGNDIDVVIPSSINGLNVVSIAENAFNNSQVEKVYFPQTMKEIKTQAFLDCEELEEIHYWTSLEKISDNSFVNCNSLTSIAINCSTYPKYLNSFARGNFADKLDHVELLSSNGPTILGVGSSTFQYNHSFKTMEDILAGYSCYNLACLFAMPLQLLYDFALTIADADDIVLIQLHETQASRTSPVTEMIFAYLEGDLDRFLMINYQNHKKYFLKSWISYKNTTSTMADQMSYEYYDRGLKANGDYVWSSDESKITDDNKGSGILSISKSYTYNNFEYLADLHDYHNLKTTLLTFDTYNKNAIEDMSSFYSFETLIKNNFDFRFSIIGSITDSVIEGRNFRYQDNIHLNPTGGVIHCDFLANKIKGIII